MTLQELRERVARNINYLDSDGNVVSADISATDINAYINDRYLEEVFPLLAQRMPEFFTQTAIAPTYESTGLASSSSTGTTLVSTTGIFHSGMIGAKVLNSTDSVVARITAYTSPTTVALDLTIDDDWDDDTLYVFSGDYALLGDSYDQNSITYLGIKYSSSDTDYTRVETLAFEDAYENAYGADIEDAMFSELQPKYIFDTVKTSSLPTSAVRVRPIPEEVVSDGVFLRYIEKPKKLVNDTDVPRLPRGFHLLLSHGATADALNKLMMYNEAKVYDNAGDLPHKGNGFYNRSLNNLLRWTGGEKVVRRVDFMKDRNYRVRRHI